MLFVFTEELEHVSCHSGSATLEAASPLESLLQYTHIHGSDRQFQTLFVSIAWCRVKSKCTDTEEKARQELAVCFTSETLLLSVL